MSRVGILTPMHPQCRDDFQLSCRVMTPVEGRGSSCILQSPGKAVLEDITGSSQRRQKWTGGGGVLPAPNRSQRHACTRNWACTGSQCNVNSWQLHPRPKLVQEDGTMRRPTTQILQWLCFLLPMKNHGARKVGFTWLEAI